MQTRMFALALFALAAGLFSEARIAAQQSEIKSAEWQGGEPPTQDELRQLWLQPGQFIAQRWDEPGVLQLRPDSISEAAWSAIVTNLHESVGSTHGDWVRVLGENAQYLARHGQPNANINDLWRFEVLQASGLGPVPTLDAVTDASMVTPGIGLSISRAFPNSITARYVQGPFGYGWTFSWNLKLTEETNGLVQIGSCCGGTQSRYEPDTRTPGKYFSMPGDAATLRKLGTGTFELRDPNGTVTRFAANGNLDAVEDPNGNRVTAGYDGLNRLQTLTHTSGASLTIGYNGAGRIAFVSDSAGRTNTFAYDGTGNYLTTATTSDGKTTVYTYQTTGDARVLHALTSIERGGTTQQFTYDTRGRLDSTFRAGNQQLIRFTYDSAGTVFVADSLGTNQLFYNESGLLTKVVDPLGHITSSEFDDDFRLKKLILPTGENQSFAWSDSGNLLSLVDEAGHSTSFAYEPAFNRLASFTDAKANTTHCTYDASGNLLSRVYPNNSVERFANYDSAGLPLSYTNRRGQPLTYQYNTTGQITNQVFSDGSSNRFAYDARGNLTNVIEHTLFGTNKVTAYAYAPANDGDRLKRVTYPNGRFLDYTYDSFGRRIQMTDQDGYATKYEYDSAGRLWKLRDETNTVLVTYAYDPSGRLSRIDKGNDTFTTYQYDAAGQLLHLTNSAPNGSVNSRFDYTYDRRGRRTSMSTLDGDWTYGYDAIGQLTHAVLVSINTNIPNQDLTYDYDPLGNRVRTIENGVTNAYLANNLNQYTSVAGTNQQYDADGNLMFDGMNTYEWDQQSRLVRVTGPSGVTEYEYDAFGNRMATVQNGERTDYLLDLPGFVSVVAENGNGAVLTARNFHGLGMIGRAANTEAVNFYDHDGIGSVVGVTGAAGSMLNRYSYSPFGRTTVASASVVNAFQYAGQLGITKEQGGLVFMRARFFDETAGRFISLDPIGIAAGGANFYQYVGNGPLDDVDPLGLSRWRQMKALNGLIQYSGAKREFFTDIFDGKGIGCASAKLAGGLAGGAAFGALFGAAGFAIAGPVGGWVGNFAGNEFGGWFGKTAASAAVDIFGNGNNGGSGGCCGDCGPSSPPPGLPPEPGGTSGTASATDPNEKLGPIGFGAANFLAPGASLPYRIKFENFGPGSVGANGTPLPSQVWASAPAQEVEITDQLSPSLDWSTFRFTGLGFGDTIRALEPPRSYFQTILPVTINGQSFDVHFEASLDLATGRLRAVFRSIDPNTSLPPDVLTGFLPPNNTNGIGQGFIEYTIEPRAGLPTGTQIRNIALISFDRQPTIATDQIDPLNSAAGNDPNKQALVTIDAGAPTSSVASLPAESGRTFVVQWSGNDDAGGSGIASYDLFISTNGGPASLWFQTTNAGGAIFQGELSQTYAFYSVARDNVGNVESAPLVPDAQTMIITNAPLLATVEDTSIDPGSNLSVTNVVQGSAVGSFLFSLGAGPAGVSVNPTNGILNWTPNCSQGNATNVISVWVTDSARTNISDLTTFLVAVDRCVEPSLGQVVLLAGTSGKVPINLISKAALTNLQATLISTPGRLLDFNIEPTTTNVCTTSVTPLSNGWHRLELATCTNAYLSGTQQVAWLHFTAADLASAFVPLSLTNLSGFESNGTPVANFAPQSGRVVVVSDEPLLECVRGTNDQPVILLYGKPAPGYSIETKTNVAALSWQTALNNLTMTDLLLEITPPASTSPANFYRAKRVGSITPARFIGASLVGSSNIVLQVRGLANRAYGIQTSPSLSSPAWQTIGSITCNGGGISRFTNSLSPPSGQRFYRTLTSD